MLLSCFRHDPVSEDEAQGGLAYQGTFRAKMRANLVSPSFICFEHVVMQRFPIAGLRGRTIEDEVEESRSKSP